MPKKEHRPHNAKHMDKENTPALAGLNTGCPEEEAVASADEDGRVGAQSQARSSTPEATAKQRTHPWVYV
jgi:hypothetical protein